VSATRPISVQTSQNDTSTPQSPRTAAGEQNRHAPHPCARPLFRPSLRASVFNVRALYADGLSEFSGRKVAEYPNLPGRRENEVLGPFDMHILMQE
jgi:hypothetical protein